MNNKLFVGNLSFDAAEDDLQTLFAGAGSVEEAIIVRDKFSGRARGFGFVTMTTDEEAQSAVEKFHGHEMMGRPLTVNVARPREDRPSHGGGGGGGQRRGGGGGYDRNRGGFDRNRGGRDRR